MTITATQLKTFLITRVGDLPGGPVDLNIELIWEMHSDKANLGPLMQFRYALVEAIDTMLGNKKELYINFMTDRVTIDNSDQRDTLNKLRDATLAQIKMVEGRASAARGGAIGAITTTTPIQSPTAGIYQPEDPSARIYRGDPYWPRE
jgi:hypothetical protein